MASKSLIRQFSMLVVFLAAVMLAACGTDEDDSTIEGLEIDFKVQDKFGTETRTFAAGDEIRFVFIVSNNTSSSKRLSYTHPAYSIHVRRVADGQVVWDPHYGQLFPQVLTTVNVAAGETLEFEQAWDMQPTPELADAVPPGEYDAEPGFLMFDADNDGELRLDEKDDIRLTIQ